MICVYCVKPFSKTEPRLKRGSFGVHYFCQRERENSGGAFLDAEGAVMIGSARIAGDDAHDLIVLAIRTRLDEAAARRAAKYAGMRGA